MRIAVIGSGYVGLVAGTCFSDSGNDVTLVDMDERKVQLLREGGCPIYEPGLTELISRNAQAGRLSFSTDLPGAVAGAEVVVLAVGTPSASDGTVDMTAIDAAAAQVAQALTGYAVIVTKSTVPVGTHKRLTDIMACQTEHAFDYVSNPEFLKEGAAIGDFMSPDRVIIGVTSDRARKTMEHLYSPFMLRSNRLMVMDPASAELTKYACNAMLATRVSFMNEMARLCEDFGANVENVRRGMGSDHRIGPSFLYPSLGYGGSCFPKDVNGLMSMGRARNHPMHIVEAVDLANREQGQWAFSRLKARFGGNLSGKHLAVWGLAFKANTDDIRESPAVAMVQRIVGAGATVAAHDPQAIDNARAVLGEHSVTYHQNMYDALAGASCLVVCTEWKEYRTPDFKRIADLLAEPLIVDGRNIYGLEWMAETGIGYISIGRPVVNAGPHRSSE